jgi:MoaA/NifB/PqqE/SkfB family radical SAM enzyme
MCSIWQVNERQADTESRELTAEEIAHFLDISPPLQSLQTVGLTGGEPFLRDDLTAIAGAFIQRYPRALISIATNGLLPSVIEKKVQEIMEMRPSQLSISVSLDGIWERHDAVRGIEGAYPRVLSTIRILKELGINTGVNFTITAENFDQIPDVYRLTRELGVGFLAGLAHTSEIYYHNTGLDLGLDSHLEEIDTLVKAIASEMWSEQDLIRKLINPYPYFLQHIVSTHCSQARTYPCYSGTHSFFLDPYGNVHPCLMLPYRIGNIRDSEFSSFWSAPSTDAVRKSIAVRACRCWIACDVVPSLVRGMQSVGWNLGTLVRGGHR